MAYLYKRVKGRTIPEFIAHHDGVQDELERVVFEASVRASEDLLEHRFEGHAAVEIDHGDIDWFLTLSDERGQKAAMSIEYGRQAGTREIENEDGSIGEVRVGAMEGLYILHNAFDLKKKKKGKVDLE